jgi:hypothetical protein
VDDCSALIDMPEASASAAYARYLRADIHFLREQEGDWQSALDDYSAVINMPYVPAELKARALLRQGGIYQHRGQEGDWQRAMEDFSAIIDMPEAPIEVKAEARQNLSGLGF